MFLCLSREDLKAETEIKIMAAQDRRYTRIMQQNFYQQKQIASTEYVNNMIDIRSLYKGATDTDDV